MAGRRKEIIACLLCVCLLLMPCYAQAASTADAKEPISTQRSCGLSVSYCYDTTAFPGQTVKLYKVAEVSADYQYTLTAPFAASGLILNGIQANSEWNVIRSTLEAYTIANNTEPVTQAVTDDSGRVCFESLKPGLYLTSAVSVVQGDLRCAFAAALIALPGLGTDGYWQYQVTVAAKPGILPPAEPGEWKVVKLWKGDENRTDRPKTIEVEIFRNGESYQTVVLSEENLWSYTWTEEKEDATWVVVERNVPDGYTMTVEKRETTFVLTNTWNSDIPPEEPPKTGDTTNVLLYTVLMCISGMLLILLGVTGKRNRI